MTTDMRLEHKGGARIARLANTLGNSTADLTITCDDLTGWPTGSTGPFFACIGRGTATEEKVLCLSRSGNVLTVYNSGGDNGRARDNTVITSHAINDTIEHIFTADEADRANAHIEATSGVHGRTGALVGTTDTQTLTGKTMSGASNTFSNIPQSAITGLVADLAAKIAASIVDAKGDLIVATAADTVARLAVGANDRYLRADSGEASGLEWAAPMWAAELVGSADPSAAASVTLEDVLFADHVTLIVYDLILSSSSSTLLARMSDGGVDASGANYNYGGYSAATGQTSAVVGFLNADGSQGTIHVARGNNAAKTRFMGVCASGIGAPVAAHQAAAHDVATAYPDLTLFPGAGTMTGRIRAYKIRNA